MPVGISAGLSIGSSIGGGLIGKSSADAAAKAAEQAAAQGNKILQGVQDQTGKNLQPFVDTGQQENSALAGLLGVGGDPAKSQAAFNNYLGSTNYQFRRNQGLDAIEYANAPAFSSSATAKALDQYASGTAGDALQGYEQLLQNGTQLGIGAASSLGGLSNDNAAAQAGNLMNAAGAQGKADFYGANALTGALKGATSGLSSFGGGVGSALSGIFGGDGGAANAYSRSPGAISEPANIFAGIGGI